MFVFFFPLRVQLDSSLFPGYVTHHQVSSAVSTPYVVSSCSMKSVTAVDEYLVFRKMSVILI